MGDCRPKILECLNDINDFLENRCECERRCPCPHHECCCEEENLFTPCRPIRRPFCDCDCNCDRCCDCNRFCDCDCDDRCHNCENVFKPCPDKRDHRLKGCCRPVCEPCRRPCPSTCCCDNDFAQILCCLIGKKVRIAIGPKCGTVCILDVQGNCVRAMVVGSGKIVIINTDQITQIRELC